MADNEQNFKYAPEAEENQKAKKTRLPFALCKATATAKNKK